MIRIAFCVPVFNHYEYIKEMLETETEIFAEYEMDLFIYDSSDNDKIKTLIEKWSLSWNNLFYVKIDNNFTANKKVYCIFEDFSKNQKYDFLWVCGDGLRFGKKGIEKIHTVLTTEYTLAVADVSDGKKLGLKEYFNKEEFFLECGIWLTMFGGVILNIEKMLSNAEWSYYEKKYLNKETLNFSHVCFYLDALNKAEKCRMLHIGLDGDEGFCSELKKQSTWRDDTFYIWCYCWPQSLKRVSGYENEKAAVIKETLSEVITLRKISGLRADGIYNLKVFMQFLSDWKTLTDIGIIKLFLIAVLPGILIKHTHGVVTDIEIRRLVRFCIKHENIYLYGAGYVGKQYVRFLKDRNIKIQGFILSDTTDWGNKYMGYDVIGFNEYVREGTREKDGIILAVNERNKKYIMKNLADTGIDVFSGSVPGVRE